jgi:hypothetical protein
MKILSSKAHGILDYATVCFLLLAPSLVDLSSAAKSFTYALAIIHLCLTLLTKFELGVYGLVPLWLHGMIELAVSILLLIATVFFGIWKNEPAFSFYVAFSVILLLVWFLSDYSFRPVKQE